MPRPLPSRRATLLGIAGAPFAAALAVANETLPTIVVTKDPSCGCCGNWVEHVRASGFRAEVIDSAQMGRVKARLGVPQALASCHTAEVGGYVIEGHVPASAIRRILRERPEAVGLAVPGMPVGSPGMEVEGSPAEAYEVILFGSAGQRPFARFRGSEEM